MKLYNTAGQQLQTMQFGTTVDLYVCGITPYDAAHMGHLFTFITYDILQRYLEHQGHTVKLARNITDVDEPIYAKAAELDCRTPSWLQTKQLISSPLWRQ